MTKANRSETDVMHKKRMAGRMYEDSDRLGLEVGEIP